jgi:hypothetical protein
LEAGYFNRDSEYFFSVDAFNENGVTIGKTIAKDNTSNLKNPKKAAISVFSNPSGGVYHVQLPEAGIVSLSNINGQSLFSAHYQQTDITIDISGYPKGVYILSCRSGNQNDKIKLIKN